MLNHYPLWKHIILIIISIIGLLYALPNLYGSNPAVQITGMTDDTDRKQTLIQVQKTLKENKITAKSVTLKKHIIFACFNNIDMQLRAYEVLRDALNNKYIVALNLTSAVPEWLSMLHAHPMKLGLDLQGGIHLLMEVDMNNILCRLQEQNIDIILNDLSNKNIEYINLNKVGNYGINISFKDHITRNQAVDYLTQHHSDLVISNISHNQLHAVMTDRRLKEAHEYSIQQNINILRKRINKLGIEEPLVQRQGSSYIVVELPGIQDIERAKEIIGTTATLEFRLVNNNINQFDVVSGNVPSDSEVKHTLEGQNILLYKRVILTGDYITDSTYSQNEYNQPQVNISLNNRGGNIMLKFTKDNIGKQMATLLVEYKDIGKKDIKGHTILMKKEEIINVANIQSILSNKFRIIGIHSQKEARQLALLLRSGALITPIHIIEERIIGPTLGMQNVKQGLKTCLAGLIISILFMIFLYKKFGIIAIIALIMNLVFLIGTMSLLPGVTLTMPGIAGIVLTLALAIDANVLINERIKEELNNGRSVQRAIDKGYMYAFNSIFDANITTLIKVIILYEVGTGTIKGFAITTGIGIATSMFTAIIGTRAMANLIYGSKHIKKLSI